MHYEIRRFNLLSVFKISFLIYLVIGFLIGMFYALVITQMLAVFSTFMGDQALEALGKLSGVGIFFMAIFMAVFMAVLWSVLTIIAAALYNLLAGSFGGIKVEVTETQAFQYMAPGAASTQVQSIPPASAPGA